MNKVKSGEQLQIKASTWNNFIDTANIVKSSQANLSSSGIKGNLKSGEIFIKNITGQNVEQFSSLAIGELLISEDELKHNPPVFAGNFVEEDSESIFAITLEPIEIGKIGKALLMGITPAKVNIQDKTHKYAEPTPSGFLQSCDSGIARILCKTNNLGLQWCMLQLGSGGSVGSGENTNSDVVMCKVIKAMSFTGAYEVELYKNGPDKKSTGTGTLFLTEISITSQLPVGSWVLGHSILIDEAGGNE